MVVLDIVVLRPIFGLAPPGFILSTHEFSEVLGVYIGSAGYCGAKTKYLVLAPPVFTLNTHEFSEVLEVYFGSAGYCGAKTNIWY